eukprot:SAG31_NODE_221_length_19918_cov_8.483829_2_plen_124_part_00
MYQLPRYGCTILSRYSCIPRGPVPKVAISRALYTCSDGDVSKGTGDSGGKSQAHSGKVQPQEHGGVDGDTTRSSIWRFSIAEATWYAYQLSASEGKGLSMGCAKKFCVRHDTYGCTCTPSSTY